MSAVADGRLQQRRPPGQGGGHQPHDHHRQPAEPDGSYKVSAILTAPKNRPVAGLYVVDYDHDGDLDISTGGGSGGRNSVNSWLNNGDGTFGNRIPSNRTPQPWRVLSPTRDYLRLTLTGSRSHAVRPWCV